MSTRTCVVALTVCGVSDLAAVPLLGVIGIAVGILGLLTLVAAFGLARGATGARPLALGTRTVDGLAAVPGLFVASGAETAAAAVTVVLSALTIGLMTLGQHAVRTA